jgi:DNA-binding transcriptional LysR family regulator
LPWIGSPEGCPFQLLGDQLFERMGGAPASRCQADLEDAIIEMIDAGLGASLLREESALEACKQDKCTIVPGVSIVTTLAMVWPRNSMVASAREAVRGVVAELWGSAFPLPAESSRLIGG